MHVDNVAPTTAAEQSFLEVFVETHRQLLEGWLAVLLFSPERFAEFERELRDFFLRFAGLAVCLLLTDERFLQSLEEAADRWRASLPGKWRYCGKRTVRVTIFNGMTVEIVTRYYVLRRDRKRGRPPGRRKKVGIYPELAALGIFERVSPAIQSEVARLSALLPSLEIARGELERRGIAMDVKTIRRIVYQTAERALYVRARELERWRAGELPMGSELAGKRVVVSIDGGKARTRQNKRGPKSKKGRSRYHTRWREPRLLIIYTVDENGRRERTFDSFVDGTLLGADAAMELLAFHLHRLGAAKAETVLFVADGAEWIWDRIEKVFSLARIPEEKRRCLLDAYHAFEHLSDALKACPALSDAERRKLFRKLRKKLKAGKASEVVAELGRRKRGARGKSAEEMGKHIAYLKKHAGHMDYGSIKRMGLPLGSGAVESAIRRVINMRVKAPGTFWQEDHLEMIVYLRAQILTGRWEELLDNIGTCKASACMDDWRFESTPMRQDSGKAACNAQDKEFTALAA